MKLQLPPNSTNLILNLSSCKFPGRPLNIYTHLRPTPCRLSSMCLRPIPHKSLQDLQYEAICSIIIDPIYLSMLWLLVDPRRRAHHFNCSSHGLRLLEHRVDSASSDSLSGMMVNSRESHVLPLSREAVEWCSLHGWNVPPRCGNPDRTFALRNCILGIISHKQQIE